MPSVIQEGNVTVVELDPAYDSLDESSVLQLSDVLLNTIDQTTTPRVVLDMSRTAFIGSRLIGVLVRAWKRVRERHGAMAFCGLRPECLEVLKVVHLDTLWPIFPSRGDAMASVANG